MVLAASDQLFEFPVYKRGIEITHGEGVYLFDASGKKYVDFYGGHAVAALGYGDAQVAATLAEAAQKLVFQSNSVELDARRSACRALSCLDPERNWSALLLNSGAEANENALRLAIRATGRAAIVAVKGAFHGRTAAASAVTWKSESWYGFPSKPFEVRWVETPEDASREIDSQVAAIIVEPVQGVAGAVDLPLDLLEAIQTAARSSGALVIADEVQSGMGRTGPSFAFQETPLNPDMVTVGKGIAAGFPASALMARQELVSDLKIGEFGTTFGGGPLASALIQLMARRITEPGFQANVRARSEQLRANTLGQIVSRVSGKGLLLGLTTAPPANQVIAQLQELGFLVGSSGDPHVVRLLPPLIIDADSCNQFAYALKEIGN